MEAPSPHLHSRVEALLKKRSVAWRHATGGYSPAQRWVVILDDGSSVFVKAPPDPATTPPERVHELAGYLRAEFRIYSELRASFLAELVGWQDDGDFVILILEDLSQGFWPPPWTIERVESALRTLSSLHSKRLPWLPSLREGHGDRLDQAWSEVAKSPGPFLSLGLVTPAWLDKSLPTLIAAERTAPIDGEEVIHFDVRSDNLCFIGGRAVLVDWNLACRGAGDFDTAFWLPSLQAEGGPRPEEILPRTPELAALVAGFFAARAGLEAIPDAPRVRDVQLAQLRTALPWAVRALGLPPLDGPNAPPH